MENATYASRMRYLDASDVDDAVVDYDGLDVHGPDGRTIGDVDGFIIDVEARRVNYVVIDSGGWFTSRRLLLPIGHASIRADRRGLQTDVTRDALGRLPEFDPRAFRDFTDEELRAFERDTVVACCPDEPLEDVSVTSWGYDSRRHFQQPGWWENRYAPERLQSLDHVADSVRPTRSGAERSAAGMSQAVPPAAVRETGERELVTAREDRIDTARGSRTDRLREDRADASRTAGDVSPHREGRAQPGDVLGIETGGERTGVGETAEEEDKRRQDAERASRGH